MGITQFSMDMIRQFGGEAPNIRHLLVGCQNMYDNAHYGMIAQKYYRGLGQTVESIDITGCQESIKHDLRKPLKMDRFDLISQHGTLEHVETRKGFYLAHKHLHAVLKLGGIIIHENPKTGNWKGHGNHYLTQDFYLDLAVLMDYNVLAIGEHSAMSNTKDGWNIYCVFQIIDITQKKFISEEEFNKLPIYDT